MGQVINEVDWKSEVFRGSVGLKVCVVSERCGTDNGNCYRAEG